ncbi:MAG TPA: carboxylating nicotinate-nucleotide diphosphorylase [Candidatus Hydrogenedentes bacterium]|nr:carboxylating nicotinate-nucleotide diphosphorylase [Candidatus Hydrogenedentota bacterium]HOT51695.1 carboxylating nicotinate-nucleotide diphosphorylase [Candidatus Hydrogenedentota bacterium]HOV73160.1 carboxylating nicotinate-nucleotide diphosphorylase [Candidatus Hydrogenedentota bacterium]HPC16808.1 carboxylating nicotinate-nucleotide diphosphorylase [Candidatus Hydrogenedentota bacterium]HRT18527.1 carboxylating nicotinate-nucleotide diphosphorylase [Candidatus Hydrogenedentota bacteri
MNKSLKRLVMEALEEDIGHEDITTNRTVPAHTRCRARLVAKQDGVLSGMGVFRLAFDCMKARIEDWQAVSDGARFTRGDELASFKGDARAVLTAERTALNFLQRLSGIATLTARYVAAVEDLNVRICDTRKTTPLMRRLEKEAVVHGGGSNHRFNLFNGILIKENHIRAAGGIGAAVYNASGGAHHLMKIEVEVSNLDEFDEAIRAGADAIMLDNMSLNDMREAVRRARDHHVVIEASGNASLENIRAIAETGVHIISVGALTHSAPAADLSLLFC